jgi:hypothetical protein
MPTSPPKPELPALLRCVSCGWVHYAAAEGEEALDRCFKCKGLDFEIVAAPEVPRGVTILPLRLPKNDAASAIRELAAKHNVAYIETPTDVLGHHITRLSGDEVTLDETELLLLALQRAGHISRTDSVRLHVAYLREKREMEIAKRVMKKRRNALRALAKR